MYPCRARGALVLLSWTQQTGYQVAVESQQPESGQPHPDHVKSQRPCLGVVSLQMNKINSWKCFHKGVFPLLVSASVKNTDLKVNSLGCCEGANTDFPAHPQLRQLCFLCPSFRHHPVSPGRPEDAAPRVQGVPQKQATGTPGAQETGPCLRASVSRLGSPPSELSPLSSDQARWPGGEKGGPS